MEFIAADIDRMHRLYARRSECGPLRLLSRPLSRASSRATYRGSLGVLKLPQAFLLGHAGPVVGRADQLPPTPPLGGDVPLPPRQPPDPVL